MTVSKTKLAIAAALFLSTTTAFAELVPDKDTANLNTVCGSNQQVTCFVGTESDGDKLILLTANGTTYRLEQTDDYMSNGNRVYSRSVRFKVAPADKNPSTSVELDSVANAEWVALKNVTRGAGGNPTGGVLGKGVTDATGGTEIIYHYSEDTEVSLFIKYKGEWLKVTNDFVGYGSWDYQRSYCIPGTGCSSDYFTVTLDKSARRETGAPE